MRHIFMRVFLFSAMILALTPAAPAEIVDQVVATVGQEAILQSDLMSEMAFFLRDLNTSGMTREQMDSAFRQRMNETLEQAVENRILLREALMAGGTVEDQAIEKRIEELKKLFDSNEAFLAELEKFGETMPELRERIRKQLLANYMMASKMQQFMKEAVVSESDVAQYYQDHQDEFVFPERVYIRQIFMAADDSNRDVVRARMAQIKKELDAGGDFAALAKAHSEGVGAEEGGVIGWVAKGDLKPELEEAALGLQDSAVSDIVQSAEGLHILKADERKDAGKAELDEVRKDIGPKLREQYAQERYKKWMSELRKRSRVQIFVE